MAFKSISGKQALPNGTKVKYNLAPGVDTTSVVKNLDLIKDFMVGTKVSDLEVLKGTGKIIGISTELPIMGFMYIIETDSKISDTYPYTSFVCPEVYLEQN
jgi:hypothetical protein